MLLCAITVTEEKAPTPSPCVADAVADTHLTTFTPGIIFMYDGL